MASSPKKDPHRISTVHDARSTRELRAAILKSQALSDDLANAVADVFERHNVRFGDDKIVSLEPVVTTKVADHLLSPMVAGTNLVAHTDDPTAAVHVVETRSVARNYAVTASAWTG